MLWACCPYVPHPESSQRARALAAMSMNTSVYVHMRANLTMATTGLTRARKELGQAAFFHVHVLLRGMRETWYLLTDTFNSKIYLVSLWNRVIFAKHITLIILLVSRTHEDRTWGKWVFRPCLQPSLVQIHKKKLCWFKVVVFSGTLDEARRLAASYTLVDVGRESGRSILRLVSMVFH